MVPSVNFSSFCYFSLSFRLVSLILMYQAQNAPKNIQKNYFRRKIPRSIECCRQHWPNIKEKPESRKNLSIFEKFITQKKTFFPRIPAECKFFLPWLVIYYENLLKLGREVENYVYFWMKNFPKWQWDVRE